MAIKASGINYFYNQIGIPTGLFDVLYTFEEGAGGTMASISGGQSYYTGVLSSVGQFWSKPGSGLFSGNYLTVANGSGLAALSFTHLIAYEQRATGQQVLVNTRVGASGYTIGLTATNRLYFEANNGGEIVAAGYTNLSSKNLVSVSYLNNSVSLGLYNFNAQSFEVETFNYPYGTMRSDAWTIGSGFTGYMDYYLYLEQYASPTLLNRLASGFYNIPTGTGFVLTTICNTGITGYVATPFFLTGITGYNIVNSGTSGVGMFTGLFPATSISIPQTGILLSGTNYVAATGLICNTITGAPATLFNTLTGYALSYGMDKIVVMNYTQSGDILKYGNTTTPNNDLWNKGPTPLISGFDTATFYQTGQLQLFINGLLQAGYEFYLSQNYLTVTGANVFDTITYDAYSGAQIIVTGGAFSFPLLYTGQEVYLNGLNLVSGYDFRVSAGTFTLTGGNTGISGLVIVSPVGLITSTGTFTVLYSGKFNRGSSNLYFNGQRMQLNGDFVEGGTYDMLTSNSYNEYNNSPIYSNGGDNWEAS